MENMNSPTYLDKVQTKILENLRHINAPSVQMHSIFSEFINLSDVPNDLYSSDDNDYDMDVRTTQRMSDKRRQVPEEHSDSEDEGGNRRNRASYKERSSLLSHDRGEDNMEVDEYDDGEADDEGN